MAKHFIDISDFKKQLDEIIELAKKIKKIQKNFHPIVKIKHSV